MGDGIRKITEDVASGAGRQKKPAKTNRMLALTEPQFTRMQTYCKAKKWFVSDIVDRLIAEFLREADADVRATLGEGPSADQSPGGDTSV